MYNLCICKVHHSAILLCKSYDERKSQVDPVWYFPSLDGIGDARRLSGE